MSPDVPAWSRQAVIYNVYPRSLRDWVGPNEEEAPAS